LGFTVYKGQLIEPAALAKVVVHLRAGFVKEFTVDT